MISEFRRFSRKSCGPVLRVCAALWFASGMPFQTVAAKQTVTNSATPCPSDNSDRSICGIVHPEDMVPLAGSEWVIVSGYSSDSLYRISSRTRKAANLLDGVRFRWNRTAYPNCPGPLEVGGLTGHGIALSRGRSPQLFVISHGQRESIEVFDVRRRDAALTWVGCIPVPVDMMANSLVALRSGALVVTSLASPGTDFLTNIIAGRQTGDVRTWSAQLGWRTILGSSGSGPNGLALSDDDKSVYVAMSGSRDIVRLYLDGKTAPIRSAKMDILPDNLRSTPDGRLITTGMRYDPDANARCFKEVNCKPPFEVYEIDTRTLALTMLTGRIDHGSIHLPTTALRIGQDVWISSIGADRVFVFPFRR